MEIFRLAASLIQCAPETGATRAQQRALGIVRRYFPARTFTHRTFQYRGVPGALITPRGLGNPSLLLCGHLDVIPATVAQYHPVVRGDRLYGRGAFDMLGPLAAMAVAMRTTVERNRHHSVGLLCTLDEERGGRDGVGAWVGAHATRLPRVVIVPDAGNNFALVIEEKGVIGVEVHVTGCAAHAARPWEGESAIAQAMDGIRRLERTFPTPQRATMWRTTAVVTKFRAGVVGNQVPAEAQLSINVRRILRDSPSLVLRKVRAAFPGARTTVTMTGEAYAVSPHDPNIQAFRHTLSRVVGRSVPLVRYPASCDARFFAAHGVPVILTRPSGDGAHGPKEWTSLRGLEQFAVAVATFIERRT